MKTILLKNSHTMRLSLADPTQVAEDDFEKVAIETLKELYPDCHVFSYKPTIMHDGVGWKPDVAVVAKDYSYWFVIEVEIASHSLQKHVLPQVRAIRLGEYSESACAWLARALNIAKDVAETIIRYVPRYTAVVTNHEDGGWAAVLAAENTELITIASYEGSGADRTALFVDGSLAPAQMSLGFGKVVVTMQVVTLPAGAFWRSQTYRIMDPWGSANWTCHVEGNTAWLTKNQGIIQLPDACWVHLIQQNGLIEMRPLLMN